MPWSLPNEDMQMVERFTVEEGYAISLMFFLELWTLIEPVIAVTTIDLNTYILFFREVCLGYEASAEWIEAVRRATGFSRMEQKTLKLSDGQLFSCAIEFCKLHNERWDSEIDYAVQFLDSMKKDPDKHRREWDLWETTKTDYMSKRVKFTRNFDWSAQLP
jgi:hypothetical protein